ncbi:M48 family metalloprotease [Streptomyces sp. NPDC101160]|uniref:M48 family metalloprotease n=1 Tax=Streptomyces sp. NPDC101160 TaxID=3366118 RepID=UPI00382CBE1F
MTDASALSGRVRPDPFAVTSGTTLRFGLLVLAMSAAATTVGVAWTGWLVVPDGADPEAMRNCLFGILDDVRAGRPAPDSEQWARMCGGMSPLRSALVTVVPLALFWAAVLALYWVRPALRVRRRGLRPFPVAALPGTARELDRLRELSGVREPVGFLVDLLDRGVTGLAFGRRGRRHIVLARGLLQLYERDPVAFRAIVLHELAHLRNRDVDIAFVTDAAWFVYLRGLLVPALLTPLTPWLNPAGSGPVLFYLLSAGHLVLVGVVVPLARKSVLRSRELHADARAALVPGGAEGLRAVLTAEAAARPPQQPRPSRRRRHRKAGRAAPPAEPVPPLAEPAPRLTEPVPRLAEPVPLSTEPAPGLAEPVRPSAELALRSAEPVPPPAEPAPGSAEPAPGSAELAPRLAEPVRPSAELALRSAEPAPGSAEPAPPPVEPVRPSAEPVPRLAEPESLSAEPAPRLAEPVPPSAEPAPRSESAAPSAEPAPPPAGVSDPEDVLANHPGPRARLRALDDPGLLFGFSPGSALAFGVAAGFAYEPVIGLTSEIPGVDRYGAVALLPLALVLGAGLALAIWRAELAAFLTGGRWRQADKAGRFLGLGLAIGSAGDDYYALTTGTVIGISPWTLLLSQLTLGTGGYLAVRWIAGAARSWVPVAMAVRRPGAVLAGLVGCTVLLVALWLAYLLQLGGWSEMLGWNGPVAGLPDGLRFPVAAVLALLPPSSAAMTALLAAVALVPLLGGLAARRAATRGAVHPGRWLLDPVPPQWRPPEPEPGPGTALRAAAWVGGGGAVLCWAVHVLSALWLPELLLWSHFLYGLVLAALVQVVLALVVERRVRGRARELSPLHGILAAALAGPPLHVGLLVSRDHFGCLHWGFAAEEYCRFVPTGAEWSIALRFQWWGLIAACLVLLLRVGLMRAKKRPQG